MARTLSLGLRRDILAVVFAGLLTDCSPYLDRTKLIVSELGLGNYFVDEK